MKGIVTYHFDKLKLRKAVAGSRNILNLGTLWDFVHATLSDPLYYHIINIFGNSSDRSSFNLIHYNF